MVFRSYYDKAQKLKQWWLTIAFVGGFVVDILTLGRVDQFFAMGILLAHILNAGTNLALLYAATADKLGEKMRAFVLRYAPLLVQFSFGSLLSGTLVFYSQSGSWSVSWPFLVLVLGVMIGNEMVRDRAERLLLNLSIFFLGIFSYCILFVPVLVKKIGPWVFVGSGTLALIVIFLYLRLLRLIVPNFIELHIRNIIFSLGIIFAVLNFLYFGNIIPPIPLSLKNIDIYHQVEKIEDGSYRLTYEEAPWYKFWRDADTTYRYTKGDEVHCFTSVFAPTSFSLRIFHHWQYFNETSGEWVTQSRIPFTISGGNERGYRGYTYVTNVHDGLWRCIVETERRQMLGSETFTIVTEATKRPLITLVK
jgi:hypothetical protein